MLTPLPRYSLESCGLIQDIWDLAGFLQLASSFRTLLSVQENLSMTAAQPSDITFTPGPCSVILHCHLSRSRERRDGGRVLVVGKGFVRMMGGSRRMAGGGVSSRLGIVAFRRW